LLKGGDAKTSGDAKAAQRIETRLDSRARGEVPVRRVEVLVSGKDPRAAALVFKTLRVGFPTAPVRVWLNGVSQEVDDAVCDEAIDMDAAACDAQTENPLTIKDTSYKMSHGEWMGKVVREGDPVVFVDTDMIFTSRVEDWSFDTGLAGRLIPSFRCPFTKCLTQPRIHTSLLFVDPDKLKREYAATAFANAFTRFSPLVDLWRAVVIPPDHFYDTAALAYTLVGGTPLTPAQLDSYDHLNAGTWVNELAPTIHDADLKAFHELAYANPAAIRGCWRNQNDWYSRQGR